jgi:hypothetical protein
VLDVFGDPDSHGEGPVHFVACGDFDGDGDDEFIGNSSLCVFLIPRFVLLHHLSPLFILSIQWRCVDQYQRKESFTTRQLM